MTGNIWRAVACWAVLCMLVAALSACRGAGGGAGNGDGPVGELRNQGGHEANAGTGGPAQLHPDPDAEMAKLSENPTMKGPNGEAPSRPSALKLTDADTAAIRQKRLKAAIAMQETASDWAKTQLRALRERFADMDIDVIAVTDAGFKPVKQIQDIEDILALKPDILVSIPVDTVATAPVYQKAADQGVKIVFMNQAPLGLRPGKDYVTIVSPDDYGNGARGAHLIARELGGKGTIGIIYHAADFSTTAIRYAAFKDAIRMYPDIRIAEAQGIAGPNFAADAENAVSGMLLRHPDIQAIWGVWDVPTKGIMTAARKAGRSDLIITTVDLGEDVAIDMARGGLVKGLGAQTVYDAGVTEATAAALAALDKRVPPFIVMDGIATDRGNVLKVWKQVYRQDAPKALAAALK